MTSLSGPLGLWKFPFLSVLFSMLNRGSQVSNTITEQPPPIQKMLTQNEERWELVRDKKGQLTGILVHRKLE